MKSTIKKVEEEGKGDRLLLREGVQHRITAGKTPERHRKDKGNNPGSNRMGSIRQKADKDRRL